jgi:hypothetical protein
MVYRCEKIEKYNVLGLLLTKMPVINRHKLNLVRGTLSLGLVVNIIYLYLLFRYDNMNTCINEMLSTTTVFNKWILITHCMLLFRIWLFSITKNYNEIDWEYHLFMINHSNKFNIGLSYKILQIVQGFIGFFNILTITHLYYNDDACIHDRHLIDFESLGFIPFIIVSIAIYLKLVICIFILIGMIILPKRVFEKIDSYIAINMVDARIQPNYPQKIYYGNDPECCVCYDIECNIMECGHLLCSVCNQKFTNRKCPLCKSELKIVETFNDYEERRDTIVNNIINKLINDVKKKY